MELDNMHPQQVFGPLKKDKAGAVKRNFYNYEDRGTAFGRLVQNFVSRGYSE